MEIIVAVGTLFGLLGIPCIVYVRREGLQTRKIENLAIKEEILSSAHLTERRVSSKLRRIAQEVNHNKEAINLLSLSLKHEIQRLKEKIKESERG